jgi:hypothetical protein
MAPSRLTIGLYGRLLCVLAAAAVLNACGSGSRVRPAAHEPRSRPTKPVATSATHSIWSAPLAADAPAASSSPQFVSALVTEEQRELAVRTGPWLNTTSDSTPVYTVPASQPTVPVKLTTTNAYLQAAFEAVPIPSNAKPAAGGDAHLTVWQPSTDTLWEFWHTSHTNGNWTAEWGGRIVHASTNPGYYQDLRSPTGQILEQHWWGATATSLPLIDGLIRISEIQQGHIDHAIGIGLPGSLLRAHAFAFPAERSDGLQATGIPEGTRFRLDPSLNLASLHLSPFLTMVAQAAQRYGMIVLDRSGCISLYAEDPTPLRSNPYPALLGPQYNTVNLLAGFPWSHIQVVSARTSVLDQRGS